MTDAASPDIDPQTPEGVLPGPSALSARASNAPLTARAPLIERGRLRDFTVLVIVSFLMMAVLWLNGAINLVPALSACLVATSAILAYFAATTPSPEVSDLPILTAAVPVAPVKPEPYSPIELLNALPLPVFEVDADRRILNANPEATRVLRLVGRDTPRTSTVIRSPALLNAIDHVVERNDASSVEIEFEGSDNDIWRAHVTRIGQDDRTLIAMEDLTAATRSAKARSDFLANASHELRTPLTSLSGFIETMRGPAKDDKDSWDRFLEIMHGETERMRRLIADLLSLSRIEFSEHERPRDRIDFASVATAAGEALQPLLADRKMRLNVTGPQTGLMTVASPDEMMQVVENLLSNAVKYSREGDGIWLEYGQADSAADARMQAGQSWTHAERMTLLSSQAEAEHPHVWLRVRDNGPGIAREHLPRLGERFYRADHSRGGKITGTGLGLAIVKHIMARHRGGLAVESAAGEGSSFGIWLPLLPAVSVGTDISD